MSTYEIRELPAPAGSAALPSVSFLGDPNTGLYSPGADQVAISTNGTGRLTVGTTAVSSTLAVDHPLGAVGTPSITFTGDLNTGFWSPAADTLAASTGGSERLRILSDGKVGLGTSGPQQKLHVLDTSAGATRTPLLIQNRGNAAGTATQIALIATGSDFGDGQFAAIKAYSSQGVGNTSHDLAFLTCTTGGTPTERLYITRTGNVGIGTTTPGYTCEIAGTLGLRMAQPSIILIDTGGGEALVQQGSSALTFHVNQNSGTQGQFIWKSSSSGAERARIDSSGRVLIGTSSATNRGAAKHIVQGDASFGDGLGKVHAIYKETTSLADAATFDVDLVSGTGTCCGFGTVFYVVGTDQQVQTFSFAGRQSGAVVQLQNAIVRNSGVSGVTVTFAAVSSAGKIRITNGSGSTLAQVQVTLFLHSTIS
jgi:ethanolamine utilization microcompartment shell protein EutS